MAEQTQKEEKKLTRAQEDALRAELLTRAQSRIDGKEACPEAYLYEAISIRQAAQDARTWQDTAKDVGFVAGISLASKLAYDHILEPAGKAAIDWLKS